MEKLNSIFFYHLDKAIKTYRQFAQANLKTNGFDITIDQWLVLKGIAENKDISQNELSEMVFKDKASVTRIIDLLVANKYLKRELHDVSRRRNKLSATPKGTKLLADIVPVVLKNRKTALDNVSERDMRSAEKVLKSIINNCKK
jgi:MarR family transcriptional regulator, transcriptional regulator for hemolysin